MNRDVKSVACTPCDHNELLVVICKTLSFSADLIRLLIALGSQHVPRRAAYRVARILHVAADGGGAGAQPQQIVTVSDNPPVPPSATKNDAEVNCEQHSLNRAASRLR